MQQDELVSMMNKIALETSSVLGYPEAVCRILLHHYKWSKETLLERQVTHMRMKHYSHGSRFYECTDVDAFFKSAHLVDPKKGKERTGVSGQCSICYERRQLTGLACGHDFCYECWDRYLVNKIADEGGAYLPCPEYKCGLIIDDERALSLKYFMSRFVESNPLLTWCPGTDCGRIVEVSHAEARPITCNCGYMFCFFCSHAWHDPVGCDLLKKWLKKCSETPNWSNAKTEDCPKCQIAVVKDAGSDHIMCGNVSCRFEFCPICLGPWSRHGCDSCNHYDYTEVKRARNPQERSRDALRRYLHYRNRYMNHQNSLKLEHKMEQHGFPWRDTQVLNQAAAVLSEARRTLMYTYVLAFYLTPNNATKLVDDNLQDLEQSTEQLSEFVERDLDNEDISLAAFAALKQKVEDKYRYVDQRRHMLLKHCAEGKVKGEWKFNANVE